MDIKITQAPFAKANDLPFEVVERKGIGHPDTLCDAIAERASRLYSLYFLETYGRLAHHWFDKVMLIGGQAELRYGYGRLIHPFKVLFAGKGVLQVGNSKVPIDHIVREAAAQVLTEVLRDFEASKHLIVTSMLLDYRGPVNVASRYTPETPADLFDPDNKKRVSNDCNVCSGFSPLSSLESMVVQTENYLHSAQYTTKNLDTGLDIKIVGTRKENVVEMFVNIPFIAKHISTYENYLRRVSEVRNDIINFIGQKFELETTIVVNPQNINGKPYLTVTGTVADTGDLGVVGRGNRLNGIITPMRPMSIEASSGKNPIDHTGKLYGILSQRIADTIHRDVGLDNQVHLTTLKERPIDDPQDVLIYLHDDQNRIKNSRKIEAIVKNEVENVCDITKELIHQGVTMW